MSRATLLLLALAAAGYGCSDDEDDNPSQGGSGRAGMAGSSGARPDSGGSGGTDNPGGSGGSSAGASGSAANGGASGSSGSGGQGGGSAGAPPLEPCTTAGERECVDPTLARECVDGFWQPKSCASQCTDGTCITATSLALGHQQSCAVLSDRTARCWGAGEYGKLGNNKQTQQLLPVEVLTPAGTSPMANVTQVASGAQHACALVDGGVSCWGHNFFGQLGNASSGAGTSSLPPVAVLAGSAGTAPLTGVSSISARGFNTCALLQDGTARCWGKAQYGQLGGGISGTADGSRPVVVRHVSAPSAPLQNLTAISVGYFHACALTSQGQVACWGDDALGQLGDGAANTQARSNAVTVLDEATQLPLAGVTAIAAGYFHTCAVIANGGVKCWGDGTFGQLGNAAHGAGLTATAAVSVRNAANDGALTGVALLAAGLGYTCGLTTGGGVFCWGDDRYGQLGDNVAATPAVRATPGVVVAGAANAAPLSGVTALAAGLHHTCALTTSKAVKCWGRNKYGELTARTDAAAPRDVFWWDPNG